ncbi:MAG: hypothetical protein NT157_04935, partial [Candidatus Micrarchaeota archaeon]|nr:hypothetical protein [Candidatus Micrarchaeota archaeon]
MAGSISTDVDELIGILRGKGTASIDELAGELGVQPKLVESWLYALEDSGKVIVRHRLMRTYAEWIGGGESTTATITAPRPRAAREDERMDIRKSVRDEVLRPREFEPIKSVKRDEARTGEKTRLEREIEDAR